MQTEIAGRQTDVHRHAPAQDDETLLTSAQTGARYGGVSRMCLWRWCRSDDLRFPQPVHINGRNYWRLGDLRRWQGAQTTKKATA